jgi:hypothetical protein
MLEWGPRDQKNKQEGPLFRTEGGAQAAQEQQPAQGSHTPPHQGKGAKEQKVIAPHKDNT